MVPARHNSLDTLFNKKAWFFLHAFFFAFFSPAAIHADTCILSGQELQRLEQVTITHIVDGDTLTLSDKRKLRLLGINTPEKRNHQPLANEAAQVLRQKLEALQKGNTGKPDSWQAYLKTGQQPLDKYGRTLGALFTEDGINLGAALLAEGMGFLVAIPPNLDELICYQKARDKARSVGKGVWSATFAEYYSPKDSSNLKEKDAGFQRIRGRLLTVETSRNDWWLRLEGKAVLRIQGKHQPWFDFKSLENLKGKLLEASGWVVYRDSPSVRANNYAPFMMLLTHPVHIQVVDTKAKES